MVIVYKTKGRLLHTNSLFVICVTYLFLAAAAQAQAPVSKVPALVIGGEPSAYDTRPFIQGLSGKYRQLKSRSGLRHLGDLPLYQIKLEFDMLSAQASATEEINYKNTTGKAISSIIFRTMANAPALSSEAGQNIRIKESAINKVPAEIEQITPTVYRLTLPAALQPGHRVLLSLRYHLKIPALPSQARVPGGVITPNDMMRQVFGKQAPAGYGVLGHIDGIFNLGYFYPVLASRNTSDWDTSEPSGMGDMSNFQTANYQVKVRIPQSAFCATSGVQVGTNPLGSGPQANVDIFFIGTAIRNFAMQISTRYQLAEKKVRGLNIRYVYLPEHESGTASVLEQVAGAVDTYSRLFGPYPYPELDVVEAPLMGGAGGIEYPGMVTVAMGLGSIRSGKSKMGMAGALMSANNTYEFVLAHEIAHQWFNGLVGSDSRLYPFLDEALANYSAVLYFEAKHNSKAATEQFMNQLVMPYQLMRAMGGPDKAANLPSNSYANQLQYSAVIYGKGALFYHALRKKIGRKRLFKALREYVRRYSFRKATPKDLLDTLASVSGRPKLVRRLYKRWIEQTHGDQDIGLADLNQAMGQLMQQAAQMKGQMQGFHNYRIQGLDPATLKMFQRALQGMQGGP